MLPSLLLTWHRRRALLLEHSRSSFGPLGAYQDATADAVAASGKGCLWNQDVLAMLPPAGLRLRSSVPALGGTLISIEAERA
jgi:methyltransferase OMS1